MTRRLYSREVWSRWLQKHYRAKNWLGHFYSHKGYDLFLQTEDDLWSFLPWYIPLTKHPLHKHHQNNIKGGYQVSPNTFTANALIKTKEEKATVDSCIRTLNIAQSKYLLKGIAVQHLLYWDSLTKPENRSSVKQCIKSSNVQCMHFGWTGRHQCTSSISQTLQEEFSNDE